MKILKGRVDWLAGNHERPYLYLLVDDVPTRDDLRFEERKGMYYGERDGFCHYFSWHRGFEDPELAGRSVLAKPYILINMHDGTQRAIRGETYGASTAYLNELGFGPCMEIRYTRSADIYRDGRTFGVGAARLALLREYARVIDVGTGYTWRPGSRYAAEVCFPQGSCFALACTGKATVYQRHNRDYRFVARPEVFPDGARIEDVRAALQAALDAKAHDLANEIAGRYARHLPGGDVDTLLALSGYEPAVKLPDGSFWTRPATD